MPSYRRPAITQLLALGFPLLAALFAQAQPQPENVDGFVSRVKPAVVLVKVKHVLGGSTHGSGFIYHPSGYVVTNHHVVEGAVGITVMLADRRSFPAAVVDYVRKEEYAGGELKTILDLAVLKIDASGLPTIPLRDTFTIRQGQELQVLGFPAGTATEQVSVTRGSVSSVRSGWIQTDAVLQRAYSGGPAFDRQGRLVGVATIVAGAFKKIGGAVTIGSVRDIATSAMDPAATRHRDIQVSGMEYTLPARPGKKKLWKERYSGATSSPPRVREYVAEATRVQDSVGALLFTVLTTTGSKITSFRDSDGEYTIAHSTTGNWIHSYLKRKLFLPFPVVVGRSWQNQWRSENPSAKITRQYAGDFEIAGTSETISVPAGTFSQAVVIQSRVRVQETQGNRAVSWHFNETIWVARGLGTVRIAWEDPQTKAMYITELLKAF